MTKVLTCTCVHEFQDQTYGHKKRVHNAMAKNRIGFFRCTVCGDERKANEPISILTIKKGSKKSV